MEFRMNLLATAILVLLVSLSSQAPKKFVFFHNFEVPSNIYVNAAHGPALTKHDPDGKTEIINLLLYPADKRSRAPKTARAVINVGAARGFITLRQDNPPTGSTFIAGSLIGLTPGKHDLKIFEFGDIRDSCKFIGDVYNPYNLEEAVIYRRPIGELGSVMADSNGQADIAISDPFVSLVGPRSVIGRAIGIIKSEELVTKQLDVEVMPGKLQRRNDKIARRDEDGLQETDLKVIHLPNEEITNDDDKETLANLENGDEETTEKSETLALVRPVPEISTDVRKGDETILEADGMGNLRTECCQQRGRSEVPDCCHHTSTSEQVMCCELLLREGCGVIGYAF